VPLPPELPAFPADSAGACIALRIVAIDLHIDYHRIVPVGAAARLAA
jgi:hypothetical protein